jgi:hypothetical protein
MVCTIANAMNPATNTQHGWSAMMDDLCIVSPGEAECRDSLDILTGVLDRVGITEHLGKREFGQAITLLGKTVDVGKCTISVPPERLYKYLYRLHTALLALQHEDEKIRREITTDDLSSIVGVLQWLAETTIAGGLHLSNLYRVTAAGVSLHHGDTRLGVIQELQWWADQAASGTLRGVLPLDGHQAAPRVETLSSDASSGAIASVWEKEVIWRKLTGSPRRKTFDGDMDPGSGEQALGSPQRELKAAALGLETFGPRMPRGTRVGLLMDCTPAVLAINKGRMMGDTTGSSQKDLDRIYAVMQKHELHVCAIFIPREFLTTADGATKCPTPLALQQWAAPQGLQATAQVPAGAAFET